MGSGTNNGRLLYEFGPFQLDPEMRRLLRNGEVVHLYPKAIEILTLLIRNRPRTLRRELLMEVLWPDTVVEDSNLTVAISHLRKALNQPDNTAEFIQTIPRVGYRFVSDVREVPRKKETLAPSFEDSEVEGAGIAGDTPLESQTATFVDSRFPATSPRQSNRILAGATVIAFGLILIGLFAHRLGSGSSHPTVASNKPKTLAVLPFQYAQSKTPEDEYFGPSISDSLSTRLGQVRQFAVRPMSSVLKLKNAEDPLDAGRKLEVDGIVEGRIERFENRVQVIARLWRVSDGVLLWTESFEEDFSSLFALEENISRRVVHSLQLKLTPDEQERLTTRQATNSEAFHAYLRGRHAWNKRSPDEIKKAIKFFQQAIDLDPTYAAAHAGLADCYLALGDYAAAPPDETFPLAKGAALRALEIDDASAEAHTTLAHTKFLFYRDWAAAEREYLRAIELKPNHATAHHWYGLFLAAKGRTDEALQEIKLAQDLDPLSHIISANVGLIEYFARRYDDAIEHERKVLDADPNFVQARRKLAYCLEAKGMEEEAIAEWLTVEQQLGADPEMLENYRKACAADGIRGYWQTALEIEKKDTDNAAGSLASYYARLNDRDQAFFWLDRACNQRAPWLVYSKVTPVFDNLRTDPRFKEVLQRLDL